MIWLLALVLIILFIGFIASGSKAEANKSNIPKTKEIDVPDPTVTSPENFLNFIERTPADFLWQVESQLRQRNKLKDIVLAEAISEKSYKSTFDKEKYLSIIRKIQVGSYDIDEIKIPDGFHFVASINIAGAFIANRKKYIIFDLNEGDELCLKPEPFNAYDKNAIAIFRDNHLLGYVPAIDCQNIREEITFEHIIKVADIIYKDDFIDVITYLYRSEIKHKKPEYYLNQQTLMDLRAKKIKTEFLRPKKGAEDINAFYKKKVVITGDFNRFPDRNDLAQLIFDSGADIDMCVTERVSYMIAGENAGWMKLEKAKKFDIVIFNEKQILKIFDLENL